MRYLETVARKILPFGRIYLFWCPRCEKRLESEVARTFVTPCMSTLVSYCRDCASTMPTGLMGVGKSVGIWGEVRRDVGEYEGVRRRCEEVCWDVKEVMGDVGEVWDEVPDFPASPPPLNTLILHTLPHLSATLFCTPHTSLTSSLTPPPTYPDALPHTPHTHPMHSPTSSLSPFLTSPITSPHPNTHPHVSPHLPLHPNTLSQTSPQSQHFTTPSQHRN